MKIGRGGDEFEGDAGGSDDFGRGRDFDERDRERGGGGRGVHLGEYVQQVVDTDQVTVLVVAHHPLGRVVDLGILR